MQKSPRLIAFDKSVRNRFNVYNSLFLNLPFRKISNVGVLVPLITQMAQKGLEKGIDPLEILDNFFTTHAGLSGENDKIDFMFRVIQYVERQIVLYDSVEDAAFPEIEKHGNHLSIADFIHLWENKKQGENIAEKLSSFSARMVLTAHPTQFYTPAVLDIIGRLRSLVRENDIDGIDLVLKQLGLTSLVNSEKPTPFEEAKNIIYFLRNVYYHAVGELYSYIKKNFPDNSFNNPDIIKLGFWPGGDRDGNPYVTSHTTLQVADELRMTLMKCYYQDIKALEQKLTFRGVDTIIADLRSRVYHSIFDPEKNMSFDEIVNPLIQVKDTIIASYNSLYLDELEQLIDKIKIFRTHFAVLDIRQDHRVHKSCIEEVFRKEKIVNESLDELKKDDLVNILINSQIKLKPELFADELIKDTILTIQQLKKIQAKNGMEGCHRYVISNSEDIYAVLFVFALLRWGLQDETMPFDIVPLFESMNGMDKAASIMKTLFEIPVYRKHLSNRQNKQTIMLGFSDGTKDGGYLKANWSIYKTKETLTALCLEYGIKPIFFDGRGGPPARGGGKTHRFYAAQGPEIANHEIQLTIQGQTITSKYGTKEQFVHHYEQLLTAGLSNSFFDKEKAISAESKAMIEDLARISNEKYLALKKHPMFLPYLENKSTLKYYNQANIGSRPAKRGGGKKLEFKDLRAIPFVGSWSQMRQNVPGFFGIGTALNEYVKQGKLEDLKKLFCQVPYFKALILNSMMSLTKCNFALTSYIARDPEYKEFWNLLHHEFNLSREMVLLISGYQILMQEEPVSRNSIEIREKIVLPLLIVQQYALQKIQMDSPFKEAYEKIVIRSLYGNINASRNSA